MTNPTSTYRQQMIFEQDDRNRRLERLTGRQRRRLRKKAAAVFRCQTCRRDVRLSWKILSCDGATPKCRECGSPLQIVTACLMKGVLPKL
jgi:hypothetical protein